MILEQYRSTKCYKICGRIGIFALPLSICIAKWCNLVGIGMNKYNFIPGLVKAFTLFPIIFVLASFFITLTAGCIFEARLGKTTINTNLFADIGYVMYILFMLSSLFILFI